MKRTLTLIGVAQFVALLLASPALAEGSAKSDLIWQWINFVLLIAVLVFVARKPIRGFLAARRYTIQQNLDQSRTMLESAEAKLKEWTEKIERLDEIVLDMERTAAERTAKERDQILVQAEATANRIKADARTVIDQELHRARAELRTEAANLAIDLAAKLIESKISSADQQRLIGEFIAKLEALPTGQDVAGLAQPAKRN